MKRVKSFEVREVELPWSAGLLSARLWKAGGKTVVGVPELGLRCYGESEPEAVFRLFSTLLKYHRQLKLFPERLGDRGKQHLELLGGWVEAIENRIKAPVPNPNKVVSFARGRNR